MRKAERHDFIYIAHVAELQALTFSDGTRTGQHHCSPRPSYLADMLSIGGSVTLRKFGQAIATYKETCSPAQVCRMTQNSIQMSKIMCLGCRHRHLSRLKNVSSCLLEARSALWRHWLET